MTKQKKIIFEILKTTDKHPTAEQIYEQAKKELPDISLATVYRNLKLLKDMGEVVELRCGNTHHRYDGNVDGHYHFICQSCSEILDLDIETVDLNKKVERLLDAKVNSHRMEFYGLCAKCKNP